MTVRLVGPSSLSHRVAVSRGVHLASVCHDELRTRGTNAYVIIERRGRANHALGPLLYDDGGYVTIIPG